MPTVTRLLLACHAAKRILAMLPDPPDGLAPRGLRILDVVAELFEKSRQVRVGDVSDSMGVSRPGVTRDIARLEEQGYLKKEPSQKDRRIVYVTLTEEGMRVREPVEPHGRVGAVPFSCSRREGRGCRRG